MQVRSRMQTATPNSLPQRLSEAEISRRLLRVYRVLGVFDDARDRSEAQPSEVTENTPERTDKDR